MAGKPSRSAANVALRAMLTHSSVSASICSAMRSTLLAAIGARPRSASPLASESMTRLAASNCRTTRLKSGRSVSASAEKTPISINTVPPVSVCALALAVADEAAGADMVGERARTRSKGMRASECSQKWNFGSAKTWWRESGKHVESS